MTKMLKHAACPDISGIMNISDLSLTTIPAVDIFQPYREGRQV